MSDSSTLMPHYVFIRQRETEIETDSVLAGLFIVNTSRHIPLTQDDRREIDALVRRIVGFANSGHLPHNVAVSVLREGKQLPGRLDVPIEVMEKWIIEKHVLGIRIDRNGRGSIIVDRENWALARPQGNG
jgi:hypothetical protein